MYFFTDPKLIIMELSTYKGNNLPILLSETSQKKNGRLGRLIMFAMMALLFLPVALQAEVSLSSEGILFSEDFEAGLSERWVEQGFPGISRRNIFFLDREANGNHYLKVKSSNSYSGKGVYLNFSPEECPLVSWRWKIGNIVERADITQKEGDDAAAKLYVIFDGPSFWNPLDKRILVYVWDNVAPVGAVLNNAWLPEKERMIIVESGKANVGQWVEEQVHLFADFQWAFPGEEPGEVEGLAFLADTDNTQSQVTAGFDDLMIRCEKSVAEKLIN